MFENNNFILISGFIGYAPELYEIATLHDVRNLDDDQLYYTEIFLDKELRGKYSMKLDTQAKIFQNLNGQYGKASISCLISDIPRNGYLCLTTPVQVIVIDASMN